jgi:hypothetical protein
MASKIESAVIPSLVLEVEDREYIVEFPLSAVIEAEEQTGKPLKSLGDWFVLASKDVPAVLHAGLAKRHPDITPEQIQDICDRLNPEALDEVLYALCKLAFPRRMAALEESRAKATKGTSPNE